MQAVANILALDLLGLAHYLIRSAFRIVFVAFTPPFLPVLPIRLLLKAVYYCYLVCFAGVISVKMRFKILLGCKSSTEE